MTCFLNHINASRTSLSIHSTVRTPTAFNMKPVVLVSVLLAVVAVSLTAPVPDLKESADTSSATSAEVASRQTSESGSVEIIRDKKAAPCNDDATRTAAQASSSSSSASSDASQDPSSNEERHKGVKLIPVQVPVTKTKLIKVPIEHHDYGGHGSHYSYGGHREDSWSQQNIVPEQQRFSYGYDPDFAAFQRASEQNLVAAEMAARAEWQARASEQKMLAQEMAAKELAARAEWQARASEQQLAAAAFRAEMVAKAQAHARAEAEAHAEIIAQQEQLQQQALEAQRLQMEQLARNQEMEEAQMQQQAQESSSRSAYASVPLSGGYSGSGASAAAYFPHVPFSRNCGGIPLMFGCSPTLVRGVLAGGHGYGGGGGAVASFGGLGYGGGGGYQWDGIGYGGGGYKEAAGDAAVLRNNISLTTEEQSALMKLLRQLNPEQQLIMQQMIDRLNLQANTQTN